MRTLVFTGPTLSATEATWLLPGCEVHPPVAAGDLLRLDPQAGDLVIVIDGYYHRCQAVRHKEILHLIDRGVEVWGAASMGALRAAELGRYGMRGHGRIHRLLSLGILDGDDEVAVMHGPAERGYPAQTLALVDVRYLCRRAEADGGLSAADAATIVTATAALPFTHRDADAIAAAGRRGGLSDQGTAVLRGLLGPDFNSRKHDDAIGLLRHLGERKRRPPAAAELPSVRMHSLLQQWRNENHGAEVDGESISDLDALAFCQLHAPDFGELQRTIAIECVIDLLLSGQPIMVSGDEGADARRHRVARSCAGHHLPDVLAEAAVAVGLLHPESRSWEARWLRPSERDLPFSARAALLAVRGCTVTPGVPLHGPLIAALERSGALARSRQLAALARRFNRELAQRDHRFAEHRISRERIRAWYAQRWSCSDEEMPTAVLDRGFVGIEDFLGHARRFYLCDRYRDDFRGFRVSVATNPVAV